MKKAFARLFLPTLLLSVSILTAADIPYLTGRVTDDAGILSNETREVLSAMMKSHEDRTTNQIAVLTVPTIGGEGIEEYAAEVFEAWKLGQRGQDNGILIVVVPNDRRMRIEVGYGLEPVLTDGTAGQIIRTVMTPRFKDGDYNGGVREGVEAVIGVLEGGEIPESALADMPAESSGGLQFEGPDLGIMERILIGAFIFGIIGLFTVMGVLTPGVGWFLYVFLIPFWAMFPIVVLGSRGAFYLLITYIIGFPIAKIMLKRTAWYKKANNSLRTKGRASIGGFTFSSGGSGSSWSSGSGSSFSGGGGSSGGGGASGSW